MDNVFSKFSKEGLTPSGHKTGQKLLMKDDAKIASGTVLEAAHKLNPHEVPSFLDANFENSWSHFDQNHEGWIRYEETHTFQRHLMGQLNKFPTPQDLSPTSPPVDQSTHWCTHLTPRLSQSVMYEDLAENAKDDKEKCRTKRFIYGVSLNSH